jgi:hypothetical protein
MHVSCELHACLLGPRWTKILAPVSCLVIGITWLMIINSEYLILLPLGFSSFGCVCIMCLHVSKEEEEE